MSSLSSSTSNSNSASVSRRRRAAAAQGQSATRTKKVFIICAVLCVFLWWSRVVTAACSLMIWHYNYLIAIEIAFAWDTSRMLIYHTSKLIMYLTYVARIHRSFNASVYRYPRWFIGALTGFILVDYALKLAVYVTLNEMSSGAIQDKGRASSFLNNAFVFLLVEELLVTVCLIVAFVRPLIVMSKRVLSEDILAIMSRYLILGLASILSSVALSLFRLAYVASFDLMVVWMTAVWVSIDCLINTWCTVLLFSFAETTYEMGCGCVDGRLKQCVRDAHRANKQRGEKTNRGEKTGIEIMTKVNSVAEDEI